MKMIPDPRANAFTGITIGADKGTPLMGDPEAEELVVEVVEGGAMPADMPTGRKDFHQMIRLFGLPCLRQRRVHLNRIKHLQWIHNH